MICVRGCLLETTSSKTWSDPSFWRELCVRQLCACRLVHLDLCCYKRTGRKLTGFTSRWRSKVLFKWKLHCSPCKAPMTPAVKCGRLFAIIFLCYKVLGKHAEKGTVNRLEDNIRMDFKDLRWYLARSGQGPLARSSCSLSLALVCLSHRFVFPSFLSLHVREFISLPVHPPSPTTLSLAVT